jgi:hypothetical protein
VQTGVFVQSPWCQLIAVARLMFFIPGQGTTGASLRIEDIRRLIQKLTAMQLVFPSYVRPKPRLPAQVTLPASLRSIPKPALLTYPAPPPPVDMPALVPLPSPPVLVPRPMLHQLPAAPAVPRAPQLGPHPAAPVQLPRPKLHLMPPRPDYPPISDPDPPDPFLPKLCLGGVGAGVLLLPVARPVGVIAMLGFGAWWLVMFLTEGMRREISRRSLKKKHEAECAAIDEEYAERVQPIVKANRKLLAAWEAAIADMAAKHARLCGVVDEENRRMIVSWEATKASIEANHERITQEIEQVNYSILLDWEGENAVRKANYDNARRKVELENQRRISAWHALTASRQADHDRKCGEIDGQNRKLITAWETVNAPWIEEQKRWRDRAASAEAELKRSEDELKAQRSVSVMRFQQRKAAADGVIKSHDDVRQDYERDLRQAEINSRNIQLEEYLDKSLIRNAKLKGITDGRINGLESFGVETAKDVAILDHQKVPGIGPVLRQRLTDWRDKLASAFRPQHGLPESEKSRVATRYAPVLLPLGQSLQTAIAALEVITTSHRAAEAERVKSIATIAQELAVAEAYVRTMNMA